MSAALFDSLLVALGLLGGLLLQTFIAGRTVGVEEKMIQGHDEMLKKIDSAVDVLERSVTALTLGMQHLEKYDFLPRKEFNLLHESLLDQVRAVREEFQRHLKVCDIIRYGNKVRPEP